MLWKLIQIQIISKMFQIFFQFSPTTAEPDEPTRMSPYLCQSLGLTPIKKGKGASARKGHSPLSSLSIVFHLTHFGGSGILIYKIIIFTRLPGTVPQLIGLFLFCIEYSWGWTKLIVVLSGKKNRVELSWVVAI